MVPATNIAPFSRVFRPPRGIGDPEFAPVAGVGVRGELEYFGVSIARQRPRFLGGETLSVGKARGVGCRVRSVGGNRIGGVAERDDTGDEEREAQKDGAKMHGGTERRRTRLGELRCNDAKGWTTKHTKAGKISPCSSFAYRE